MQKTPSFNMLKTYKNFFLLNKNFLLRKRYNFREINIMGEYENEVCIFSFRKSNGYIQAKVDYVPSSTTGLSVSARVATYK